MKAKEGVESNPKIKVLLIKQDREYLPHQQRVIEEKRELDKKIEKLEKFFDTATYHQLEDEERIRLLHQRLHMNNYSEVLGERIQAFR